ncbi:hypothetical protein CLM65_18940 [Serratia marcescens]|nr:hypothetical protein AM470_19175 [Serratia marcescens]AVN49850.1 hypothetical protein AM478_08930 [Serratia marcescens]AWC74023.1 hypothetical protein AM371_03335 [Serratia marcescens]AWC89479.1 hypothetical protein AM370_11180 [Serratia marcescens]AWS58316.1 hypothetical protein AM369_08465 [Serratia marcescens]
MLGLFLFFMMLQGAANGCAKTILRAKRNARRVGEMNILRAGALDLCLWSFCERYKEKSPESISINPRPTLTRHNVKLASYPPRGKEKKA